jgi:hypothetical protein
LCCGTVPGCFVMWRHCLRCSLVENPHLYNEYSCFGYHCILFNAIALYKCGFE